MFEPNDELSNTATSSASQIVMGEAPDRNLALDLVRVTEAAALAAGHWMGRGQKEAGDGAQRRLLSASVAEILSIISVALNKPLRDLTVFVLDKLRVISAVAYQLESNIS